MKRNSKRTRKVRNLVLISAMSALLLVVSTYAWFIGMQTVKVNSFEVEIAAVDSLMLSMDGTTWETSINVADAKVYEGNANEFLTDDKEGLKPISTIGEFDETSSRLKLYEKGSLTANAGGYRLMASRVDNYNGAKKESGYATSAGEYLEGDGYVAFDLFVMNLSGDAYYAENNQANEEAIYLTYDSEVTAGTTGNTVSGIENSVRVGFAQIARVSATTYGNLGDDDAAKLKTVTSMSCTPSSSDVTKICRKAQIWEPNETKHVEAAKTWYTKTCITREPDTGTKTFTYSADKTPCASLDQYRATYAVANEIDQDDYVDVYDGVYNSYAQDSTLLNPVITFTDSDKLKTGAERKTFMTLAPNSITKIRIYVWIEGQDVDNYDFASLGHSIKVNFGFTKERFTSGEIGSDINPDSNLNAEKLPSAQTPSVN